MSETVKRYNLRQNMPSTATTFLPDVVVSASDYARLEQECERLRGLLAESREIISRGDFDTGVCCCGDDVGKHGLGDGHSPVDEGGYYADCLMNRISTALSPKP